MTMHLMQLLRRSGYAFHTSAEFEIVRQLKEKLCVCEPLSTKKENAFNSIKPNEDGSLTNFVLPDGT